MLKAAIIAVSGWRARGLADAYAHVKRAQLAAISTRQRDNLDAFGERYGINSRYTDYRKMFEREKPDIVHVNTPPHVRLEIFKAAEAAGIPAVIVEKPLAIQAEDFSGNPRLRRQQASCQDRHQSSAALSSAPAATAESGTGRRDW